MELLEPGYKNAFKNLKYILGILIAMNLLFIYSFPEFGLHLKILLCLLGVLAYLILKYIPEEEITG